MSHEQFPTDSSASGTGGSQTRRTFLRWMIGASFVGYAVAFAIPALALRALTREQESIAAGDALVFAAEDLRGVPINADDLEPGTAVQAFPNEAATDSNNLVELVRLDTDPSSIVAYSAICTHLGCTVQPNLSEEGNIVCLCHGSVFDPSDNAEVVSGPATRPLPALPIEVGEDGIIMVAGEFIGDVGPE